MKKLIVIGLLLLCGTIFAQNALKRTAQTIKECMEDNDCDYSYWIADGWDQKAYMAAKEGSNVMTMEWAYNVAYDATYFIFYVCYDDGNCSMYLISQEPLDPAFIRAVQDSN